MKETTLEQFTKEPQAFAQAAQTEQVLVTRDGKPFALLVGLANKDEEDWGLETAPSFWQMIEERRGRPTIPLHDAEAMLFSSSDPSQ